MNLLKKLKNRVPVMLFRKDFSKFSDFSEEFNSCKKWSHDTYEKRSEIPRNSLVIGRYSVLPYYKELQEDLSLNNSILINSLEEHSWIADFRWYQDLKRYTPTSWKEEEFIPSNFKRSQAFVVKGATNSRKHEWNSMMFASSPEEAVKVSIRLRTDSLIETQEIIFREYIPLETFEIGIHDLPFTNEWRVFCLEDEIICSGYYWSIAECAEKMTETPAEVISFAREVAKIVQEHATFYVLDIAKTQEGKWILMENKSPWIENPVMCAPTEEAARKWIEGANGIKKRYRGWNGKEYPIFSIHQIPMIAEGTK